jgi:hypothetical protein
MSPLIRQMQQCHQHYFSVTNYNAHHDHIIGFYYYYYHFIVQALHVMHA